MTELTGKLMFTVYDYTGATRLFAEDFITKPAAERKTKEPAGDGPPPPTPPPIVVDGFEVHISPAGPVRRGPRTRQGHAGARGRIQSGVVRPPHRRVPTLKEFRARWVQPRNARKSSMPSSARATPQRPAPAGRHERYDLFDVKPTGLWPRAPHSGRSGLRFPVQAFVLVGDAPLPARATIEPSPINSPSRHRGFGEPAHFSNAGGIAAAA